MYLSIIIPVFNEEKKITTDVTLAFNFLMNFDLEGEIIVVDDGSSDETVKVLTELQRSSRFKFKLLQHPKNQGKGSAVKTGVLASKGEYVMFVDSGYCIPYKHAIKGLQLLSSNEYDLAFGSRKHKDSIITSPQNFYRRIVSRLFNMIVVKFLNIPSAFTDTQCGFKIFNGDVARKLFRLCQTKGFTFDIEILIRALNEGYRIAEFPVEWSNDTDTRVCTFKASGSVLEELFKTKKLLLSLEKAS